MCSNIRLSRTKSIKKGQKALYHTYMTYFSQTGTFGFSLGWASGIIYNVRSEKLSSGNDKWQGQLLKRGIIKITGFVEGSFEFTTIKEEPMYAAILYNDKGEFAIITEDSAGVVSAYHKRMPVLIDSSPRSMTAWFVEGRIRHLDPAKLKRA